MLRNYAASLILVPVILAAWLTIRSEPVTGLPLDKVLMYVAPEETSEVADSKADELISLN